MSGEEARLSVLLTAKDADSIQPVLARYRAQGDPGRLEIVVADVDGSLSSIADLECGGFRDVRIVDAAASSLAGAERLALASASAPLVIFAQAHALPLPGFVDAAVRAWENGSWAVISLRLVNGNPLRPFSRAAMRIHYDGWTSGGAGDGPDTAPGHNSVLDRRALLGLGAELEGLLEAGSALLWALTAKGHRIRAQPAAAIEILLPSLPRSYFADLYHQGCVYAALRRRNWGRPRRALYALGAPVIPARRLWKMANGGRSVDSGGTLLARVLLFLGLLVSAAGEGSGYAFGRDDLPAARARSLRRFRDLHPDERP